jgi:hypothetical protein
VPDKINFRYVTVRGARYLHIDDVVSYVLQFSATEETDTRHRLDEAARALKEGR